MVSFYHIFSFKYKSELENSKKDHLEKVFVSMLQECKRDGQPYIRSLNGGEQTSTEFLSQKLERVYILEFETNEDRQYYHKSDAFHKSLIPLCIEYTEGAVALDYSA